MLVMPYLAFIRWSIPHFQIKLSIYLVGDDNFHVAKNVLLIPSQDWVETQILGQYKKTSLISFNFRAFISGFIVFIPI